MIDPAPVEGFPPGCALIEIHLGELMQLFNSLDPMWRPLEIFLYDWWPIRAEAWLFDRLAAMTVRIQRLHPA